MKVERLKVVSRWSIMLLLVGILYLLIVYKTGYGIPCFFRLFTGLYCPGCGITHMFLALFCLDIQTAWSSHPILLLMLPVLCGLLIKNLMCYVWNGSKRISRLDAAILYICAVLLVAYAVYHNIIEWGM